MEITPKTHQLKCDSHFFRLLKKGTKNFEIRRFDRDFAVGDTLLLREWLPNAGEYSGESLERKITFLLCNFEGITSGFCVLGLAPAPALETATVSRETPALSWREDFFCGNILISKRVVLDGTAYPYSFGNPAALRCASIDRAAQLLNVLERIVIAHALGANMDATVGEGRALVEDIYDATVPLYQPSNFDVSNLLAEIESIESIESEAK